MNQGLAMKAIANAITNTYQSSGCPAPPLNMCKEHDYQRSCTMKARKPQLYVAIVSSRHGLLNPIVHPAPPPQLPQLSLSFARLSSMVQETARTYRMLTATMHTLLDHFPFAHVADPFSCNCELIKDGKPRAQQGPGFLVHRTRMQVPGRPTLQSMQHAANSNAC